jgi:AcrR family transcriptional regulator
VPTRRNLVRPKETILAVATELFSQQSYGGTTIRDIARAVGVLPGSDKVADRLADVVLGGLLRG